MINSKYNIYSKLQFDDITPSNTPIPYLSVISDDNSLIKSRMNWTNITFNINSPRATIESYNGNKVYHKTDNFDYLMSWYTSNTSPITADMFKLYNFQIEFNIKIKCFNSFNGVLGFAESASRILYMGIANNRLSLEVYSTATPNYTTINFPFEFKENVDYNIIVTKNFNDYSLMVDGLEVSKCTSNTYINPLRANVSSAQTILGGYDSSIYSEAVTDAYIWGVQMCFGGYELKYTDSFSKYGTKLTSYLNFANSGMQCTTSTNTGNPATAQLYVATGLETKLTPRNTWIYGAFDAKGAYLVNNNTTFVTNINSDSTNKFTSTFGIKNDYNVNNIELVNLGGGYKVLYTSIRIEPTVTVNANTTSALDFESGITDKIGTTIWTKESTGDNTSNRIFGTSSYKSNGLQQSIYTSSNILTGGNTPFTIEFYSLVNGYNDINGNIFLSKNIDNSNGEQWLRQNPNTLNLEYVRNTTHPNTPSTISSSGTTKINYNEINKITMTYDGAAIRTFINDSLDNIYGSEYGINITSEPLRFLGSSIPLLSSYRGYKGLIDNINIFDGVANKVRNDDNNSDKLIIDLAFDGVNNSTNIVDNGTLDLSWNTNNVVSISTSKKYEGYSSLYNASTSLNVLYSTIPQLLQSDFTLSFAFYNESNFTSYKRIVQLGSSNVDGGLWIIGENGGMTSFIQIQDSGSIKTISGTIPTVLNTWNKIDVVRKNGIFYIYLNNNLINIDSNNITYSLTETTLRLFSDNTSNNDNFIGYVDSFKLYKDIAILPENTNDKVKLEFDNNLNDSYNNSSWTNNSVSFDNVNSVKGYSGIFTSSTSYAETTSTNITNLKDNDFSFKFDSNLSSFVASGEIFTNAQAPNNDSSVYISSHNSTGGWRNLGINLGGTAAYTMSGTIYPNIWYNDYMMKRNRVTITKRNGVLISTNNIADNVITNINGAMRIGKPSSTFGSAFNGINGVVDNFEIVNDDISYRDVTVYNGVGVTQRLVGDALLTKFIGTPSADIYNTVVLNDSPSLSNFIVEADIFIKSNANESNNNHGGIAFRTTDFSLNNMEKFGYLAYLSGNVLILGKGSNNATAGLTILATSSTLGSQYMDDKYHKLRLEVNVSNFKVYLDDILQLDVSDSTYTTSSKIAWFTYLNSGLTNVSSNLKTIKISTLTGTELLYKNFKSKIDSEIDNAALNLPLESYVSNSNILANIGYTPLTITYTGTQVYQHRKVLGKACMVGANGKYIIISNNNILNFGSDAEFYFSMEFYPTNVTRRSSLINCSTASLGTSPAYFGVDTQANGSKVYFRNHVSGGAILYTTNAIIPNSWNNVRFYRKQGKLYINLNGIITEFINQPVNFASGTNNTVIGNATWTTTEFVDYYRNIKLFNGTNDASAYVDDNRVIDIDFAPTNESYLFKDNFNKCVLHPVNITERDYQDSKYCSYFNGTDQCIQLGQNGLWNFGNDRWMIQLKFKITEYVNSSRIIIGSNFTGTATIDNPLSYISITSSSDTVPNSLLFYNANSTSSTSDIRFTSKTIPLNQIIDAKIICESGKIRMFINGKEEGNHITNFSQYNNTNTVNFNSGNNTFIGKNTTGSFAKMYMYRIRAFRNTSDMSLLDDEILQHYEKYTLTNGVDTQVIEYTDSLENHQVKIIADIDKLTLDVNDTSVFIPKTTSTNNLTLFNGYKGDIKDIKLYDDAFYDSDTFIGSTLVDTEIVDVELLGEDLIALDTYDIGDFVISGFIEGYTDHEYRIQDKVEGFVLVSGVEDYYATVDPSKLSYYEIYDLVTKESYPLYNQPMIKGYIYGKVNVQDCANNQNALEVRCFRSDNKRFIGSYKPDSNGDYNIPNLDVNAKYDLILVDTERTIEQQVSSYRTPTSY